MATFYKFTGYIENDAAILIRDYDRISLPAKYVQEHKNDEIHISKRNWNFCEKKDLINKTIKS